MARTWTDGRRARSLTPYCDWAVMAWDVVQDEQGGYGDRGEGIRVPMNVAKLDQARRWSRISWIDLDHGAYGADLKTRGEIISLVGQMQRLGRERLQ
jgi:hypothetical protein